MLLLQKSKKKAPGAVKKYAPKLFFCFLFQKNGLKKAKKCIQKSKDLPFVEQPKKLINARKNKKRSRFGFSKTRHFWKQKILLLKNNGHNIEPCFGLISPVSRM